MADTKNDIAVHNDDGSSLEDSIREECEQLITCDSIHPASANGRSVGEWIASRPWGQMLFKSVDRVLWCVERVMLWQNPSPDALVPMVRPVNVLVAYPLAAFLWILQHLIFATAETSSGNELIKWAQIRRRRLRALRFQGIRNMRSNNVLGRPETSYFAQVFWFLGLLQTGKIASEDFDLKKNSENEKDVSITAEDEDSEQNKKRRYSAVSVAEEGSVLLDDEYNSASDSDYVPECSHSSESDSDSDVSSDEDEEEAEANLNESVLDTQVTKTTPDAPAPKD